ncbi:MAG: DUF4157 domain-containing protein, partial [Myxococcota bacterium]|nr:DUF4157 domain-containing protein [Myxococcota bacterium]
SARSPAALAERATAGPGQPLPFLDLVQASFGRHDVSKVRAHVGGEAAEAAGQLGAQAFAVRDQVAFAGPPDLHTAAHEAAHVVQQRAGVALEGGIDQPGDAYEHHADRVADAVVGGESAEPLLDTMAGSGARASASNAVVQRKSGGDRGPGRRPSGFARYLYVHEIALRGALAEHLAGTEWPDPAPDVPFAPGGHSRFSASLVASIAARLGDGDTLPQLLHPSKIVELFHQFVPTLEHANWSRAFGQSFAQAVERVAFTSLTTRVGPRYRAAAQRVRVPRAEDVLAGHPIDPLVAQALTRPDVVDATRVAATPDRGVTAPAPVQARWLGRSHPELWNFVQVSPASASVEDVAATLWRDPASSTMAFAIRKYGDVFRIAPAHARKLINTQYRGEVVGAASGDASNEAQILALARSSLGQGDAAVRQFPQERTGTGAAQAKAAGPAGAPAVPRVEQLMAIERQIGALLEALRGQLAPLELASNLAPASDARAARVSLLADADASTRTDWLPVLQFQHAQLMTIARKLRPLASKLRLLEVLPGLALDAARRQERHELRETITMYANAAAVSHLRDQSSTLLHGISDREQAARMAGLDAVQIDLEAATREAIATPHGAPRGSVTAADHIAQQRQATLRGSGAGGSPYAQQQAITHAGELALESRMQAAEHALEQLRLVARELFPDPEELRLLLPNVKLLPEVLRDVKDHLHDVHRTWETARRDGTAVVQMDPKAPPDWAEWQGRAAGLAAARAAFAKIAGDQSIGAFLNAAVKQIRRRQLIKTIVSLAEALLITLATGMAAAAIGRMVASAIATQASGLAARSLAFAVDVSINASMNSVVQLAQADGRGSPGWAMLENTLAELFTRGMMAPLRRMQTAAQREARELARLPHLSAAERRAVRGVDFAGTTLMVEMVGGMASQWAAQRLVHTFQQSGRQVSDPFAYSVLQQGAAIAVGKFFRGRFAAWQKHRDALARTRLADLPAARELVAGREQFYRDARQLAESLSPDPAAGEKLLHDDAALIGQARALFTAGAAGGEAHAPPGARG